MKILILMLLAITTVLAISNTNIVLYNETLYNHDNYVLDSMAGEEKHKENTVQNKLRVRLYSNLTKDLYFSTTGVYNVNNVTDDYKKYIMFNKEYKDNEVYFESLYFTYNIYRKLYLTAGLVNFSCGSYTEISELDYIKGSGLSKIIDTPVEAVFLSWVDNVADWKTITKVGYGSYDKIGIPKSSEVEGTSSDSTGWYIVHDMYKDFDSIKFNYFNINVAKDGHTIANSQQVGIGFNKYYVKQGINIYSTLGYTHNKADIDYVKKYVTNITGPYIPLLYPKAFELKEDTTDGYLCSIGIDKDFSTMVIDSYSIGAEYTYTSDNWYTLVNNRVADHFNTRYLNGHNVYLWTTIRATTNTAIKIYYNAVKLTNASPIGNNTKSIPHKDSIRPFLSKLDRVGVKFIIEY